MPLPFILTHILAELYFIILKLNRFTDDSFPFLNINHAYHFNYNFAH